MKNKKAKIVNIIVLIVCFVSVIVACAVEQAQTCAEDTRLVNGVCVSETHEEMTCALLLSDNEYLRRCVDYRLGVVCYMNNYGLGCVKLEDVESLQE